MVEGEPETLSGLWERMAEQFLDTEARDRIPRLAAYAVDLGLTVDEAEQIWWTDIVPSVGFNLTLVAGEWAMWDRDWLIQRIKRRRWRARWTRAWARWTLGSMPGDVWCSVARFMTVMVAVPADERDRWVRGFERLARIAVDIGSPGWEGCEEPKTVRKLYPEPFWLAMEPALQPSERIPARDRIVAWLDEV